jgi:hypothetical protein
MAWHKFLMKHGLGSPGYIAGKLAAAYQFRKTHRPPADEGAIIRSIFVERIAAQTTFGGPSQYHLLRRNSGAIEEVVAHHPDLYSIVLLAIFIEHPELMPPYTQPDTFKVLKETVKERLDEKAPGWRTGGVWSKPGLKCSLCGERISHPDASSMYAAISEEGHMEYHCSECALPIEMRAMSDLGYFMGDRFR